MCTSIAMNAGSGFYFGRNLDLECGFGEQAALTPRGFMIRLRRAGEVRSRYAIAGMAAVEEGFPLYADACNESGLCIAGLNFPGYAHYPPDAEEGKAAIAPFELPLWLLGQCETLSQAKSLLERTQLVGVPFGGSLPLSPLHWHVADASGSIVVESTREGMRIWDNPAGVLTNNPPFDFHMTNLNQYLSLTAQQPRSCFGQSLPLSPFGRGFGAIGMPGDYSPASRFIRAAFLLHNSPQEGTGSGAIAHFFHLLDAVAMPMGSVVLDDGRPEYTRYASCMDVRRGIYYYKTYGSAGLTAVSLRGEGAQGESLMCWPLSDTWQIRREN